MLFSSIANISSHTFRELVSCTADDNSIDRNKKVGLLSDKCIKLFEFNSVDLMLYAWLCPASWLNRYGWHATCGWINLDVHPVSSSCLPVTRAPSISTHSLSYVCVYADSPSSARFIWPRGDKLRPTAIRYGFSHTDKTTPVIVTNVLLLINYKTRILSRHWFAHLKKVRG